MIKTFPIFQSHLDLAHAYWSQLVQIGDTVIDATCGNGFDTLKLCLLSLSPDRGKVYALDNQLPAITSTRNTLATHLSSEILRRVEFHHCCHSHFPYSIPPQSIKLIVYNLGYLPGGNKLHTTLAETTRQSLSQAQDLLQPGGMISMTCYPGHAEGTKEQEAILDYLSNLSPQKWSCCHHRWCNRRQAPSLILIQKSLRFLSVLKTGS